MALHDPVAPMPVLATNDMFRDPALADLSDAELEEYRKTRDFEALRPRLQGEPTTFVVQRLPPTIAITLDAMSERMRLFTAFCMACHVARLPDGAELKPEAKRMKQGAQGTRIADNEWVDAVADRYGVETVYEVGRVAHEWARLPRAARGPFSY